MSPDVFGRRASLCKECCTGENCNREICQNTGKVDTNETSQVGNNVRVLSIVKINKSVSDKSVL